MSYLIHPKNFNGETLERTGDEQIRGLRFMIGALVLTIAILVAIVWKLLSMLPAGDDFIRAIAGAQGGDRTIRFVLERPAVMAQAQGLDGQTQDVDTVAR